MLQYMHPAHSHGPRHSDRILHSSVCLLRQIKFTHTTQTDATRLGLPQGNVLQVLRQSFFFDSAVKHMGVSQTMHGISNKFLLVGTLSDQV